MTGPKWPHYPQELTEEYGVMVSYIKCAANNISQHETLQVEQMLGASERDFSMCGIIKCVCLSR